MNGARMNMTGLMLARQKAVWVAFCSSINWGKYLSKYWFLFAMLTLKMKMGMQQTRCSNVKMIKRLLISAEAFLHWSKTSRPPTQWYFLKSLPMTGFEPRTSGIGSDRSTNWATTTALKRILFALSRLRCWVRKACLIPTSRFADARTGAATLTTGPRMGTASNRRRAASSTPDRMGKRTSESGLTRSAESCFHSTSSSSTSSTGATISTTETEHGTL